ncbi:uncharacterized protein LOC141713418 isoform X2 [Apium graveolens]|uniref:uncharacterized protein LOC141713418 isoform X2 n=1 Tax=Apium graveolens TaxID=4045 RepID=UPI003D79B270
MTLSSKSEKSVMKATQPRSRKGSTRRRGGPDNASCKFKGVRQRTWGSWVSEIRELNRGKRTWIGTFKDPEAAAMAYDEAAIKLFGTNAMLNFPERLPQVSCPIHATVATSKDTLIDRKEIGIPEERIIEEQQRKCPPAEAHEKPAGSLFGQFGAYAVLNFSKSVPQVSCPVHATSKDALVNSKGVKVPEEQIIQMEQVKYSPGPIVNHDEVQGDNAGKNGDNLEERCNNIKENLMVDLPEFDDSSLWDEVMGTTDLETIENPGDLNAGVSDEIFKDILEDDLGLNNFWL